ncbi:MAG: hypothetical protein M1834_009359 [Cirrosporium novae-zelandiae]|nr:MAG: hypothetical protein M1834_009359 [Cirrosporium novae-zelandiae]
MLTIIQKAEGFIASFVMTMPRYICRDTIHKLNTKLFKAAKDGSKDEVVQLLKDGADPNAIDEERKSVPLHYTAAKADVEVSKVLLEAGADPTVKSSNGATPMIDAANSGSVEMLKLLLDSGGDPHTANSTGWTPLHSAAKGGFTEMAALLLEQKVNINATTTDKSITPLHHAASQAKFEVARLLLTHGANPNALIESGWSPLHEAANSGCAELVKLLLEDKTVDASKANTFGSTPLHLAVDGKSTSTDAARMEIVSLLLGHKIDINAKNSNGSTPLYVLVNGKASDETKIKIAEILVDNGADVNARTTRLAIALHRAAARGDIEMTEFLLNRKSDPNTVIDTKWTPLHEAANSEASEINKDKIVTMLLDYGADVHAETKNSERPLHYASARGHARVAETLINRGAGIDIDVSNTFGWTPLHKAAFNNSIRVLKLLLRKNVNVNAETKKLETGLHFAVVKHHPKVAKILLDYGANIKAVTATGWTPLHEAGNVGEREIAEILLDHGADPNALNSAGWMPLHLAANKGHAELVKLLLSRGANDQLKNASGKTALDLAKDGKFQTVVEIFDNPPAVENESRPTQTLERLRNLSFDVSPEREKISKEFKANVIYWYGQNGPQRKLPRGKYSVYDIIYGTGLDQMVNDIDEKEVMAQDWELSFRWIHLPANNKLWVKDLIKRICFLNRDTVQHFEDLLRFIDRNLLERKGSTPHSRMVRPVAQTANFNNAVELSDGLLSNSGAQLNDQKTLAFVMPYIDTDTSAGQQTLQTTIDKEISVNSGRLRNANGTSDQENSEDLNVRLVREYFSSSDLQVSQTLDQSYYLEVSDTSTRDQDQVVYRYTTERRKKLEIYDYSSNRNIQQQQVDVNPPSEVEDGIPEQDEKGAQQSSSSPVEQSEDGAIEEGAGQSSESAPAQETTTGESGQAEVQESKENPIEENEARAQKSTISQTEPENQGHQMEPLKVPSHPQILMVNQLWLFILDNKTVITAFPQRWDHDHEENMRPPKLLNSIIQKCKDQKIFSAKQLAALIAVSCTNFIEPPHKGGLEHPFLDIFADSIADVLKDETSYYDELTNLLARREKAGQIIPGQTDEINISKEIKSLREIKDILDELGMIRNILGDQHLMISQLWGIMQRKGDQDISEEDLEDYLQQGNLTGRYRIVKRLTNDAIRAEDSLNHLLDLKQKQVNIDEARSSRRQAEIASRQGNTLLVFTVVTVIFLPLQFMEALFAIDMSYFPRNKQGDVEFTNSWIWPRLTFGGIGSVLLIGLWAFKINAISAFFRNLPDLLRQQWDNLLQSLQRGLQALRPQSQSQPSTSKSELSKEKINILRASMVEKRGSSLIPREASLLSRSHSTSIPSPFSSSSSSYPQGRQNRRRIPDLETGTS